MSTFRARDRDFQNFQTDEEAWKLKVKNQTTLINTTRECLRVVEEIIHPRQLPPDGKIVISFDCEGVNLGIKGEVTLLQIATMDGKAYIFDLYTCPSLIRAGELYKILENENVIKVIHDCRNDSVNLYKQFRINLKGIFDTIAAHAIIKFQRTGQSLDRVYGVKFNDLCKLYDMPCNPIKDQLKNIYRRDQRYWARRPLTEQMIIYASSDVLSLIPEIYNTLSGLIKPEMRDLLAKLNKEQILKRIKP